MSCKQLVISFQILLKNTYRISANSFRGKYSFLKVEIQRSQYIRPKFTVHKCAETIQGRKLFKGGNYSRKYGIQITAYNGKRTIYKYHLTSEPFESHIAPVIMSKPDDSYGPLGANLTLDCEARGHPAPTITWRFVNTEGKTIALPSKFCFFFKHSTYCLIHLLVQFLTCFEFGIIKIIEKWDFSH